MPTRLCVRRAPARAVTGAVAIALAVALGLLSGREAAGGDAPALAPLAGTFTATVTGAVRRTLTGPATFYDVIVSGDNVASALDVRFHTRDERVRIAFNRERPGVPAVGAYPILDGHHDFGDRRPPTHQFWVTIDGLAANGNSFIGRGGTLRVTSTSRGQMSGTFTVRATETDEPGSAAITVQGTFTATRIQ